MELPLLLIVIGIVLAVLVHYALGIAVILIGLVLLLWPRIAGGARTDPRLAGTQSSGGARTASPLPAYRQAASASEASALASSDRDLTSSLRKALWRCHSTVLRVT